MFVSCIPGFVLGVGHLQSLGKKCRWRGLCLTKAQIFVYICPGFTDQAISFQLHFLIISLTVPPDPPTLRRLSSYQVHRTNCTVILETLASFTGYREFLGDFGHGYVKDNAQSCVGVNDDDDDDGTEIGDIENHLLF